MAKSKEKMYGEVIGDLDTIVNQIQNDVSQVLGLIKETKKQSAIGGIFDKAGGFLQDTLKAMGLMGIGAMLMSAFSSISTLMKMINVIVKLLSNILRPIGDFFLILLMPIVIMLKPIVKMVNEIMRPFRRLTITLLSEFSRSSDPTERAQLLGGAMTAIGSGLSLVIIKLLGEVIGFVIKALIQLMLTIQIQMLKLLNKILGPMLDFFGVNLDEIISTLEDSQDGINQVVDDMVDVGIAEAGIGLSRLVVGVVSSIGDNERILTAAQDFNVSMANLLNGEIFNPNSLVSITEDVENMFGDNLRTIVARGGEIGLEAGSFIVSIQETFSNLDSAFSPDANPIINKIKSEIEGIFEDAKEDAERELKKFKASLKNEREDSFTTKAGRVVAGIVDMAGGSHGAPDGQIWIPNTRSGGEPR